MAKYDAQEAENPQRTHALFKSLLAMALIENRTLILPMAACKCMVRRTGSAALGQEGSASGQAGTRGRLAVCADPQEVASTWRLAGVHVRPASFLDNDLPMSIKSSHMRVSMPDGLSANELKYALRDYGSTVLLEVERPAKSFCGWEPPHDDVHQAHLFGAQLSALFSAHSVPAATSTSGHGAGLPRCTHYHGGVGTVLNFENLGVAEKHNVSAPWPSLPSSVRKLPPGSDLLVTFATGSVATMALNWAATTRKAGVSDLLIGALDETMMLACAKAHVPCVEIQGGEVSKELAGTTGTNLRSRPSLYPKMSVLKVGFYRELLSFGFNVWACDADAVFLSDPRPLVREAEFEMGRFPVSGWHQVHIAAATDCIDIPGDSRAPLLHCDLNTGLVYMRSSPETLAFAERWRESIANAKEKRVRDQYAFNMLLKSKPLRRVNRTRAFLATNGDHGQLLLGILPLSRFLNGHTYFVQHAHTLPGAAQPVSVHMTYQFAEGSSFAYGKRQRLRQAGLWLVEEEGYFGGKYLAASVESANLPVRELDPHVMSLEAIQMHLDEARHRSRVLQALLGIAKALGRGVILPRMLCYCDFMWKEMKSCRVGGAETMRLPFECPMDHALDTPLWFEAGVKGVSIRETSFLRDPRFTNGRNQTDLVRRVSVRHGMSDIEARQLLGAEVAPVLEIENPVGAFCGFVDPAENASFEKVTRRLLHYQRSPFCYEDGTNVPGYSQCCKPRKPGDPFFPCVYGFDAPDPLPACSK